ncbi:hypothetical protein [Natrinema gelatinilyticum]|uniref:hypothetical protein n=1 Tax=Natrinema gelatinilyticum TaxID=2961571 RepID=UPI0020C59615|nr:hypothetical protein [Natrinema gelatinilyticum]
MPSARYRIPISRNLFVVLAVLCLFATPFWPAQLPLGEPTYEYERTEVTTDETSITYTSGARMYGRPISDEIACSGPEEMRACAFERSLLENETVTTNSTSINPNRTPPYFEKRYRYVQINETVYEPTYTDNTSTAESAVTGRVDLALSKVAPDRALKTVSIDITSDDLSPTVAEAARSGGAVSRQKVDVPKTPIQREDGTYYRVYLDSHRRPSSSLPQVLDLGVTYLVPLLGFWLVSRRMDRLVVTVVYDDDRS